jgi:TonB family protein
MSDQSADPAAMPTVGEDWPAGPKPPNEGWLAGPKPPSEGWSRKKFLFVLIFVFAFHVSLIVLFGSKQRIVPRPVTNFPQLQLVDSANELIALNDPTLFARPNRHDVVSAFWRRMPAVSQPNFDQPAASGYLAPESGNFGALFQDYLRNLKPPAFVSDLKPEPRQILPDVTFNPVPEATIMQISGELAQRPLLTPVEPPFFPYNDVLKPSVIQALVDTVGNVASAVVLESSDSNDADQRALQIVRDLRFAPAPNLTLGEITFTWRTVPVTGTNSVP